MSDLVTTMQQPAFDVEVDDSDAETQGTIQDTPQSLSTGGSPVPGTITVLWHFGFLTTNLFQQYIGSSVAVEPPRKRQRTEDLVEPDMNDPSSSDSKTVCIPQSPVANIFAIDEPVTPADEGENMEEGWDKDEKYYLAEGDCVIKVENVLFKVRQYALQPHSVFYAVLAFIGAPFYLIARLFCVPTYV